MIRAIIIIAMITLLAGCALMHDLQYGKTPPAYHPKPAPKFVPPHD